MAGVEFLSDMILPKRRSGSQFSGDNSLPDHTSDAFCDCFCHDIP
jgi:hypothetical protein